MARYFEYGDEAVAHLKARDPKLAQAIDVIGHVNREMMEEGDLFAAVVHHIIGQQISSAAHRISPEAVSSEARSFSGRRWMRTDPVFSA